MGSLVSVPSLVHDEDDDDEPISEDADDDDKKEEEEILDEEDEDDDFWEDNKEGDPSLPAQWAKLDESKFFEMVKIHGFKRRVDRRDPWFWNLLKRTRSRARVHAVQKDVDKRALVKKRPAWTAGGLHTH